jgi:hypothetical protein
MEMQAMLKGAKIKIPRINVVDVEQEETSELELKITDDQATTMLQNALNRKKAGG